MSELKKILGDVTATENGNGFTARHCGKSATSTSSRESAMDAVLRKVYGKSKKFFYRYVTLKCPPNKGWTYIFEAVSEGA